jgi:hypothetical protein
MMAMTVSSSIKVKPSSLALEVADGLVDKCASFMSRQNIGL